ncbi:MAG: pyruvate, phosphate dikinase, partial [Nitrospira sp.]|nr:pyruvate, phosphate dikinase [Nitrospira sp.]
QTTFGFSRDDAAKFIDHYRTVKIMDADPFATLDREGVGSLMKTAIAGGRTSRPGIKLGICGEHGGDPSSVEFCHQLGLDYVSCSPFRVAIARLAAAQAAIAEADAKAAASKKPVTVRVKRVKTTKASQPVKRAKPAPRKPSSGRKKR